MRTIFRTGLVIILASMSLSFASETRAEGNVLYFILDASGSMWERAGGKPRIVIAKETLSNLIEQTPAQIRSGVTVYGHRRKGDCSDIEEIVSLKNLDPMAKFRAQERISSINAMGKTPITDSIQQTVDRLKGEEGESTIVLISDGLESCGKDPCALTRKLKSAGINFVMHVVGFGLMDHQKKKLACIADAGEGTFFTADNASDLLEALTVVKQSVVAQVKVEPAPEPVVQKVESSSTSIKIKAKGPGTVKLLPAPWVEEPRYWALSDVESGEILYKFARVGVTPQKVPPGTYQLMWHQNEHRSARVITGQIVTVKSGEVTEVPVATGVRLTMPQWVEIPYWWGLKAKVDKSVLRPPVWFRDLPAQVVPAGRYHLIWYQNEHRTTPVDLGVIDIKMDQLNEITVATGLQLVKADWVPEIRRRWWKLLNADGEVVLKVSNFEFKPQIVPEGKYELVYRQTKHGATDSSLGTVIIKPNELAQFAVNTGVGFSYADGTEPPYMVEFSRLNEAGEVEVSVQLKKSWGPIPLQPGTYQVNYQEVRKGPVMTIVDSFDLPAGVFVEIEM
ncbi:MAG: VWA domain-containing protein [Arenicellales bacterium]|jgi:Ca-activated chloride channel family protein|nr:VWA domain-containing protein [Arenicellales bacterium]MDP7453396.1 VWA domain-containing protein [Arenicellales bacterium]|tara:strand:- start:474 stop:2162 length:1689 start_codon:yes stop_codon:yes gene_type:complete